MSNIQNSQGGIPLSDEALLDAVTLDERQFRRQCNALYWHAILLGSRMDDQSGLTSIPAVDTGNWADGKNY